MASVTFRVSDSPAPGYLLGQVVTFELPVMSEVENPAVANRRDTYSISRREQFILEAIDSTYQVQTTQHLESELPFMRMFLRSVVGGRVFTYRGLSVVMTTRDVPFQRLGRTNRYRIRFDIKVSAGTSPLIPVFERYDWNHAWDFAAAPDTPGDLPAAVSTSADIPLTAGSYTFSTTSALPDDAIGAARLDRAMAFGGTVQFSSVAATGVATQASFHVQLLYQYDTAGQFLGLGGTAGNGLFRLGGHPNGRANVLYQPNTLDALASLNGSVFIDGQWVLMDVNVRPEAQIGSGFGTRIEVMANGVLQDTVWATPPAFTGVGNDIVNMGTISAYSQSALWVALREGAQQTLERHLQDAQDLGLA